mgnify:CR=1 FL=1
MANERTMVTRWKSVVDPSVKKAAEEVGDTSEKAGKKSGAAWTAVGTAIGNLAAEGLVRAAEAAKDFAVDSFRAASDLKESVNVTQLTFGKYAPKMEAFYKTAAGTLGVSETAAREATATIGGLLQNMGLGKKETVGWSEKLLTLASDMGSAFNTDPVQAIEAISAGLRGESEPLRKYNVMLSDAALKQQAMTMGLYKGKGQLSNSAKAQAALALITKQTARVQGDFQNTSTGAANAARIQAAKVEDLKAKFANSLLPAQEAWLGFMNDKALPALGIFADQLQGGIKWVQDNAGALEGLGITVGILTGAYVLLAAAQAAQTAGGFVKYIQMVATSTKAWAVVQGILNVVMSANPIALVVIAIAALVAGIIYAYNNCETFRKVVDTAFTAIAQAGTWLWNNALKPVVQAIVRGFAWVVDGIAGMLDALGDIPGFGWAKDAANGLRGMAKSARDAADAMDGIPEPEVDTGKSRAELDKLNARIKSIKGRIVEAKAKGDTREVDRLKEKLANLRGKRVDVEARVKKTGVTTIKLKDIPQGGGLRISAYANGGIRDAAGRTKRFASGGLEDHTAQFAPAGAMRLWAEPETGGEAYLPLARSKRDKSIPLWWETGRRLGVVQHADGAVVGRAPAVSTGDDLAAAITKLADRVLTREDLQVLLDALRRATPSPKTVVRL